MKKIALLKKKENGTSLVVQWLRLCTPSAEGPGSIPRQGTRFHMQLRVHMPQLNILQATKKIPHVLTKILHAVTKTLRSQINKY